MRAIVLAGGYAKRLWPLTRDTPKPLLPVADKPIIDHIVDKIAAVPDISEIIVSTNKKFETPFSAWTAKQPNRQRLKMVIEPSQDEAVKLGSVGGLAHVLSTINEHDDTLIIGGDNLFGFNLTDFLTFAKKKNAISFAVKDLMNPSAVKEKYGVAVLDTDHKLIQFQEKPKEPASTLTSTACYVFPKDKLSLVNAYVETADNLDAMGHFITWLLSVDDVYGYVFSEEWFDIGSLDGLREADSFYSQQFKKPMSAKR